MASNPARAVTSLRTQPGSRSQIARSRVPTVAGEPASRTVSAAALITCRAVAGRMGRCSSPSTRQRSSPEIVFRPGWTRTVGLLPDPCHSMHRSRESSVHMKRSCVSDATPDFRKPEACKRCPALSQERASPYPRVGKSDAAVHRYPAACAGNRRPPTYGAPRSCLPRPFPRCR